MNYKRFAVFVAKVTAAQVTTYFLAGAIFYPLLTKPYFVGPHPIFAVFLRTEADGESEPAPCPRQETARGPAPAAISRTGSPARAAGPATS